MSVEATPVIAGLPLRRKAKDPRFVRWGLVGATVLIVGVLVGVPLVAVFSHALGRGLGTYWENLTAS